MTKMNKKTTDAQVENYKIQLEQSFDNGIDFKNRIIRVTGAIGDPGPLSGGKYFDFDIVDYALTIMEAESNEDITIRINSGGGEVYEALAIIGRMKASKCVVNTEAFGHCMSAATLILMAGDYRKLSRYCVTMYHEIGYGVSGQHEDIKEQVAQSDNEMKKLAKYYESFSNKKSAFWLGKMKKKEYYPTPEQMLEFKAVDEII